MNDSRPKITVVGSINMDLITEVDRFPQPGETIIARNFYTSPGGKGANQAVAASRLGAEVSFIGCLGNDRNGNELKKQLIQEGVEVDGVAISKQKPTGIAQITVTPNDNHIIVVSGANFELTTDWIDQHTKILTNSDIIVLQLEIPLQIVKHVVTIAKQHQVPVLLNPAPAKELPNELLQNITYLTPNETEFSFMTGCAKEEEYLGAFFNLQQTGIQHIILTRGEKGVTYMQNQQLIHRPSPKVNVVDTTGAGDAFNGALAFGIASSRSLDEAVELAIKVGAHAVTKMGAQAAMPLQKELGLF